MSKPPPSKPRTGARPKDAQGRFVWEQGEHAHIPPAGGSRKRAGQARALDTVAAILEAAALILEEDGYQAASTNAIAARAGVSIGSLYQYFASREDVFRALLKRHESEFHPVLEKAGERLAEEVEPSGLVIDLLGDLLAVHAGRPALMEALEVELEPIHPPHKGEEEARVTEMAARLLASKLPGSSEEALAKAWLVVVLTSAVSRKLAHTPPAWVDPERVKEGFAQAVRAILGPGGQQPSPKSGDE